MKLHCILLIIYFLCISVCQYAQAPEIIWQHTYGGSSDDRGQDILATDDGGYITIGYAHSNDGDITYSYGLNDFLVIKTNSVGNIEWSKNYGGTDHDKGYAICKGLDAGYVLAGSVESSDGDITFNHGGSDLWVVKINEDGNIDWAQTFGGSNGEGANKIILTMDGNYIVAGASSSNDGDVTETLGGYDYWIIKLNVSGEIIWQHSYGSSQTDIPYDIKQTADGGFIVAGYSEGDDGDVTLNKGDQDFWIIKLDSTGALQWQKSYGGSSTDQAYSIVEKPEGGYLCVGVSYSNDGDVSGSNGFGDAWVISIDNMGELEWQKCYGGTGGEGGNYIIIKIGTEYIIAGGSGAANGDVTENNGLNDYWIFSIDIEGNLNWQKSIGGSLTETAYSVCNTSDNHLIITGYSGSSDYDVTPSDGSFNFWTVKLGICEDVYYADADGDGFGNVLIDTIACEAPVGYVADSTDCDDTNNLIYPGATEILNGLDDNCDGLIDEGVNINTITPNAIKLYPNPSNTEIYIEHTLHIIAIITRNKLGEEIPLPFVNDVADISAIPSGIYFSEIRAAEGNVVLSWVKGN